MIADSFCCTGRVTVNVKVCWALSATAAAAARTLGARSGGGGGGESARCASAWATWSARWAGCACAGAGSARCRARRPRSGRPGRRGWAPARPRDRERRAVRAIHVTHMPSSDELACKGRSHAPRCTATSACGRGVFVRLLFYTCGSMKQTCVNVVSTDPLESQRWLLKTSVRLR